MRNALALAVLDRLVRERIDRLLGVPATDRAAQRATPAAERLSERGELEQVRAGSRDSRQRIERSLARGLVTEARRHGQSEERRVVLRRPSLDTDARDLRDRACAVLADALLDRPCVLAGERPLGGVVAAALRAEDQEATQTRPAVDCPREAAGVVRHLTRTGDRRPLWHATRAMTLQVRH